MDLSVLVAEFEGMDLEVACTDFLTAGKDLEANRDPDFDLDKDMDMESD